jgi:hypothetical protein
MAEDAGARRFYVSWVDRRKDPWPKWAERAEGLPDGRTRKGRSVVHRAADDPEWPGVPEILDGSPPRPYLGPILTTLFHPRSPCNLKGVQHVYLLYEKDLAERSPHEKLHHVVEQIGTARGLADWPGRVHLVPIAGITDHTDHKQILDAVRGWIDGADPFNFRRKPGREKPQIVINLTSGTPTKHASWLMLYWEGALGGNALNAFVQFVQGDESRREPLRDVPIDVLSQYVGRPAVTARPAPVAEEWVKLEDLRSQPYQELRQTIEQAALLGIPLVLVGERGTGKTALARYYHERRQAYRPAETRNAKRGARPAPRSPNSLTPRVPSNAPADTAAGNFVAVTLSEYAGLNELRDHLFGWARGSWTGAEGEYHGLLGMAHRGTLFLDEIHHLDPALQASLLGVLNNHRYRPKMADYEVQSEFDLVVATNDPQWRERLSDDFRDRIERVVLEVPSFRVLQRHDLADVWSFWDFTLKRRCRECGVEHTEVTEECRRQLEGVFRHQPLTGNWRDLMRLADQVLLLLTAARGGRPTPLTWNRDHLEQAVFRTFHSS